MADDRDYGSQNDSTVTKDRLSLGAGDANSFLTGAAIGAVVGTAFGFFLRPFSSGDEPPIRVKGGSMEFHLLTKSVFWDEIGSGKKKWKPSAGSREKVDYQVTVVSRSKDQCPRIAAGNEVIVKYSDNTTVSLIAPSKKTILTSTKPLTLSGDKLMLEYKLSTGGQIDEITVDGSPVYSSSVHGELEHILLMDY